LPEYQTPGIAGSFQGTKKSGTAAAASWEPFHTCRTSGTAGRFPVNHVYQTSGIAGSFPAKHIILKKPGTAGSWQLAASSWKPLHLRNLKKLIAFFELFLLPANL
jgi:hypothetical protein